MSRGHTVAEQERIDARAAAREAREIAFDSIRHTGGTFRIVPKQKESQFFGPYVAATVDGETVGRYRDDTGNHFSISQGKTLVVFERLSFSDFCDASTLAGEPYNFDVPGSDYGRVILVTTHR